MDWQQALRETIAAFDGAPPEWGVNDCCQFVADYLDRVGASVELPSYEGERAALRLLSDPGLEHLMDERLQRRRDSAAVPGDVVLAKHEEMTFPAVWNGRYCLMFHPQIGPARIDADVFGVWAPCQR